MDVYKGPPDYDCIMAEDAQQSPKSPNATVNSIDSDKTLTPSKYPCEDPDSRNTSVKTENDESGLQSPLTESLCIKMLNEESFASTTTNVTAMDNDSVMDEVFVCCESDIINTTEKPTDEKLDPNINTRESEGDDKVVVCITEKSEIEDLLNKGKKPKGSKFRVTSASSSEDEFPTRFRSHSEPVISNTKPRTIVIIDQKPKSIQNGLKPISESNGQSKCEDTVLDVSRLTFPGKSVYPIINGQNYLESEQRPKDYILFSCLVLVCCCSPLGLISFILSLSVNSSFEEGHYQRSRQYSRAAFWTAMFGIFVTVSLTIMLLVLFWPEHNGKIQVLENQ